MQGSRRRLCLGFGSRRNRSPHSLLAPPQPSVSHVVLGGTFPGTPSTPSGSAPGAGASARVLGGQGGWEGQQNGDWPSAQRRALSTARTCRVNRGRTRRLKTRADDAARLPPPGSAGRRERKETGEVGPWREGDTRPHGQRRCLSKDLSMVRELGRSMKLHRNWTRSSSGCPGLPGLLPASQSLLIPGSGAEGDTELQRLAPWHLG